MSINRTLFAIIITLSTVFGTIKESTGQIYFQPSAGYSFSTGPVAGVGLGYQLNKGLRIGTYNQIGTNWIKLGTIEIQQDFGRIYPIAGYTFYNSFQNANSTGRIGEQTSNGAFETGLGLRVGKRKIVANMQIRASIFSISTQSATKTMTPITFLIGITNGRR